MPRKLLQAGNNLRKSSSPNCNIFINENLTIKNNEIAFLSRKLTKIYIRDRTVHISSPEVHRGKVLKIYHTNLFNLFPYYNFGENYWENDQNDSLQSSY